MERTGALLGPVLKRLGLEEGVRFAQIKNDWHAVFHEPLSLHMSPSQFTEGILLLNVDSPIWIQQLTFYKQEILAKMRPYGVKNVRFRIGRISQKLRSIPAINELHLSEEDTAFVAGLISPIKDMELRQAIRNAAEKSLSSRKFSPKK